MSSFGKPKGFYNRQIDLFRSLCLAQASTTDIETQDAVGQIPHFDEIMKFFSQRRTQPRDRGTFVHGDFKIDNVVFHKTEPKVIGILEYVVFSCRLVLGLTFDQLGDVHNRPSSSGPL